MGLANEIILVEMTYKIGYNLYNDKSLVCIRQWEMTITHAIG